MEPYGKDWNCSSIKKCIKKDKCNLDKDIYERLLQYLDDNLTYKFLYGCGAPDDCLGNLYDFYLDVETNDYYVKTECGWKLAGSFIKCCKGERGCKGQDGQKGHQGCKGNKGDKGDKGNKGDAGVIGQKGDKGEKGGKGEEGLKGDEGDQGLKGDQGDQGLKGDQGDQGLKGDQGDQGLKGDQGDQGLKGDQGDQGLKGDQGDQGLKGDQGEKGQQGDCCGWLYWNSGSKQTSPSTFLKYGFSSSSEVETQIVVPSIQTLRNLHVRLSAAPGPGQSRTITINLNGLATTLAVTISGVATTGSNTVIIVPVVPFVLVSIQSTASSPATTPATVIASLQIMN